MPLPDAWRIALVRPRGIQGRAGDYESEAFRLLPPVPIEVTRELCRIRDAEMLLSLARSDCAAFGEAVFRFGQLAGKCFASIQGGPFASSELAGIVAAIRDYGVSGTGQSSWGPTVFAFLEHEAAASAMCEFLRHSLAVDCDFMIARPNNTGAQFSTV
jgi:predicted sugar kinase